MTYCIHLSANKLETLKFGFKKVKELYSFILIFFYKIVRVIFVLSVERWQHSSNILFVFFFEYQILEVFKKLWFI